MVVLFARRSDPFHKRLCGCVGQGASHWWHSPRARNLNNGTDRTIATLNIPNNEAEQVLSVQHGINCRREESQISEPGHATIREKVPNPFHLSRRKAVPFANRKTLVPGLPFACSLFGHGAFHSDRLVSAHSPRHRGSLMSRFTIARIVWQGWQYHEAAPLSYRRAR